MPVVSILIAALNGAPTIARAIESAQKQTVRDIQIVIVDDGSSDGTYDIAEMLAAEDARITAIRLEKNGGVGAARNVALAHATGTWVTILDADDWYEPRRLEWLLAAAERERADLVADNLRIYDHIRRCVVAQTHHDRGGKTTPLTAACFFDGDNPLKRHSLGYIQPLIRRQFVVDRKIFYDGRYKVGEDFLFVAEILLNGARAAIIPEAGYVYVHRISPTTRQISPHSHSEVESACALMARGCDELMQKYGGAMDEPARRALRRRRRILQRAVFYQEARDAVRHNRFAKALRIAAMQPIVPLLAGNIVAGVAIANVRFGFFALRRRFARPVMRSRQFG